MAFPEFQTKEVLNKVLNSGKDALKVDIDNVTLDGSQLSVDIDKENDSIVIFSNTAADGSGTNTVPLVDAAGHTQVDIVSSALPSGGATAANQATIIGHVDGVETLITSSNTKLDTLETTLTAIETDAAAIEVLLTAANVDHAANEALLTTIDADTDAIKTAVEILDNAIDGNQMQVDVVAALPAGSNAIGKLAANSGVDIGDVDVTSMPTNSATISNQTRSATSYAALTGSNLTTDNQGIFSYVIQITSTDNCILKVQGSNDNSNWVDDDMAEVTIATGASGLISGTSFFKYLRLQFKASATNGTTVNGQGFAK